VALATRPDLVATLDHERALPFHPLVAVVSWLWTGPLPVWFRRVHRQETHAWLSDPVDVFWGHLTHVLWDRSGSSGPWWSPR